MLPDDKSGRWSCDSESNYKKACKKHLDDNPTIEVINGEQHTKNEQEMNCHASALLSMMGLEEGANGDRIRNAMKAEGNPIAPFYTLGKDHKTVERGKKAEGPK